MTKPGYDHIEMLLDRSQSMTRIRRWTEDAIKSFLDEQRGVEGRTATFALRVFDDRYETSIAPTDLAVVEQVQLIPRGNTALHDAMGRGITELGEWLAAMPEDERPENVFFVTATDGMENASIEWTKEQVAELVKEQTETYNWHFAYLGANQDAMEVGSGLGVAAAGTMTYDADFEGVNRAYASASVAVAGTRSLGSKFDLNT